MTDPTVLRASTLNRLQPIVLVGGQSRRFGRDKLREPIGGAPSRWMVDAPIAALREVFGARVALVGDCDPAVAARGDFSINDEYPGFGPAGGILSALEWSVQQERSEITSRDVFVLAGDLPSITASAVRDIVAVFEKNRGDGAIEQVLSVDDITAVHDERPLVILGQSPGVEPCIGIYRQAVRHLLAQRMQAGQASLHDLVVTSRMKLVTIDKTVAVNVNTIDAIPH